MDLVTLGCFFAHLDLANAYRSVKIHNSNLNATGWMDELGFYVPSTVFQ